MGRWRVCASDGSRLRRPPLRPSAATRSTSAASPFQITAPAAPPATAVAPPTAPESMRRGDAPPIASSTSRPLALRALLLIAIVFLLKAAQPVALPITVAIVLTFVLATPLRWLRRLHVPDALGAAILVGALIGSGALLGSSLAGPATQWWQRAPSTLQQVVTQWERLRSTLSPFRRPPLAGPVPAAGSATGASRGTPAAPPPDPIRDKIASEGITLTGVVLGRTLSFGAAAAATMILLYFLLASEHWLVTRTVEALPSRRLRARVLSAVRAAQREIGHFLSTLALVNAGVGIATGLATWSLGLASPLLWGTLAAALNFVPYIGPVAMASMLLLAGMLSFDSAGAMLAPACAFVAIHATESNLVSPWFIARRLALSPLSVFIGVLFMAWLWGLGGAVIAVPMLLGLRCAARRTRSLRLLRFYLEGGGNDAPTLASLLRARRRTAPALERAAVPPGPSGVR